MQGRIRKISAGIFEDAPKVVLLSEKLSLSVYENETSKGSFTVGSLNGIALEGMAVSSSSRIHVGEGKYQGTEVMVPYAVDASNLVAGDFVHGTITFLSTGGELSIEVSARVLAHYPAWENNEARTLKEFIGITSENKDVGKKIFSSPFFPNIFSDSEENKRLLYEGLTLKNGINDQTFDEFLLGNGGVRESVIKDIGKEEDLPQTEDLKGAKKTILKAGIQRKIKRLRASHMKSYVDYSLGLKDREEWLEEEKETLGEWMDISPDDPSPKILFAYVYALSGKGKKAKSLLEECDDKVIMEDHSLWAFYDLARAKAQGGEDLVRELKAEVREFLSRDQRNDVILFCLVCMDEETSPQRKIALLRDGILSGMRSPYIYSEAVKLFREYPYLIAEAGKFEQMTISWAARRGVLTEDMADQICRFSEDLAGYSPIMFKTLCRCVSIDGKNKDRTRALISYMIKNDLVGERFIKWYELGEKASLHTAGLYENYMRSLGCLKDPDYSGISRQMKLYFSYGAKLPRPYHKAKGRRQKHV